MNTKKILEDIFYKSKFNITDLEVKNDLLTFYLNLSYMDFRTAQDFRNRVQYFSAEYFCANSLKRRGFKILRSNHFMTDTMMGVVIFIKIKFKELSPIEYYIENET